MFTKKFVASFLSTALQTTSHKKLALEAVSHYKSYKTTKGNELKYLKKHQLSLYNGQDKKEIYVAFQGKIYDVTQSNLWKKGMHYEHWAGQDLTEEMEDAPHAEEVFLKFACIGEIIS